MADNDGYKPTFGGYEAEQIADMPEENHLVEVLSVAREPLYYQRVYDVNNAQYVYYTKAFLDPTPLSSETTPNHSGGSLTNHAVVLEIYNY